MIKIVRYSRFFFFLLDFCKHKLDWSELTDAEALIPFIFSHLFHRRAFPVPKFFSTNSSTFGMAPSSGRRFSACWATFLLSHVPVSLALNRLRIKCETWAEFQFFFWPLPLRFPLVPQNGVLRQRGENTLKNGTPFDYCYIIKHRPAATAAESTNHKNQRSVLSSHWCHGSGVISAPVHNKAFMKCGLLYYLNWICQMENHGVRVGIGIGL